MADSKQTPLDAEAAAKAAFASVQDQPFPNDIFTAPELRWAVIGCGVIANQMAQSLALAGRKLAGVANRTLSKAQSFAEQYGVEKVYDTVEDLYADPNIDAVYITTPHNTHITYLRAALAAGKHVLCEKAITLNSAELDEARAIADEHNVVLMDATTVLHMPLYQELRRRMDAGEFGRMNLAQLNFGSYKEYGDLTNRFYNRNLAGVPCSILACMPCPSCASLWQASPLRLSRWATPVRPVLTLQAASSAVMPSSSWAS